MQNPKIMGRHFFSLATVLVFFLVATGCSSKSKTPEEAIKDFILQGIAAIEKNDVGGTTALLSKDYGDAASRDVRQMKQLAFFWLKRGSVTLFVEHLQIKVEGNNATVHLDLLALQGKHQIDSIKDILPDRGRHFELTLEVAKEAKEWRLRAISGDGVTLNGF